MNEFLKELYNKQDSKVNNSERVYKFTNVFSFMDFCYLHKLSPDNSITYYNEEAMYIKRV